MISMHAKKKVDSLFNSESMTSKIYALRTISNIVHCEHGSKTWNHSYHDPWLHFCVTFY